MIKFKQAFSLIELMVVITIIGILAAVAIPSYRKYITTSKIASGIPVLTQAMDQALAEYVSTGDFPSPIIIYGTSMNLATYTTLDTGIVKSMWYNAFNSYNSVHVCVYFTADIGIPGYVAPSGNNGNNNRICMNATAKNGIFEKSCGIWGMTETMDIPLEYLPTGCNCKKLYDGAIGGNPQC